MVFRSKFDLSLTYFAVKSMNEEKGRIPGKLSRQMGHCLGSSEQLCSDPESVPLKLIFKNLVLVTDASNKSPGVNPKEIFWNKFFLFFLIWTISVQYNTTY
jgi:hypothetical protein